MKYGYKIGSKLTGSHGSFTLTDCEVIGTREPCGEETWLYTWSTQDEGREVLMTGRELNAALVDGAVLEHP